MNAQALRKVVALCAGLGLLVGVSVWALQRYVQRELQRHAAAHGVELALGEQRLRMGYIEFENSAFRWNGLSGNVGALRLEFDGWRPRRVLISRVIAAGKLTRADLRGWLEEPPLGKRPSAEIMLEGSQIALTLSEPTASMPWLVLDSMSFEVNGDRTALNLPNTRLLGVNLGQLTAQVTAERWDVQGTLPQGVGTFETTALLSSTDVTLDLKLAGVALPSLTQADPRTALARVSGSLHARTARSLGSQVTGDLDLTVEGVAGSETLGPTLSKFGNRVSLRASLLLDAQYERLDFPTLTLSVGRLELRGSGRVQELGRDPRLHVSLRGMLSCQEIAASFVKAQLGSWLGGLVAQPASQIVKGKVQLEFSLDSRFSSIQSAQPNLNIAPGCGLGLP